ncbi:TPA: DUF4198 domain-containing protein [Neisseria gonorrhoeae]
MKKTLTLLAVSALFATSAHPHRVWVETAHTHGGEYLKADLGYGEFPELEPIAKDRLHIFSKPMQLVTEKGKENMIQRGTYNYQYRSNRPVKDGSYLVTAEYQPTFRSKNKAGWKQAGIKEMPDASYGERFKVRVLFRGEPLPNATVTATFDGFDTSDRSKTHKTEAQAFSDTTDGKGEVDIIPLHQGFWKASVEYKADFPDQSLCQKQANYTTLTFQIGHSHH